MTHSHGYQPARDVALRRVLVLVLWVLDTSPVPEGVKHSVTEYNDSHGYQQEYDSHGYQ